MDLKRQITARTSKFGISKFFFGAAFNRIGCDLSFLISVDECSMRKMFNTGHRFDIKSDFSGTSYIFKNVLYSFRF